MTRSTHPPGSLEAYRNRLAPGIAALADLVGAPRPSLTVDSTSECLRLNGYLLICRQELESGLIGKMDLKSLIHEVLRRPGSQIADEPSAPIADFIWEERDSLTQSASGGTDG